MKKIDNLGRVVIPKEIRKKLNIKANDIFEISCNEDYIILRPINKTCLSCGGREDLAKCGNIVLCIDCAKRISNNIKELEGE